MARTPSNMLPLGTKAPNFSLLNVNDSMILKLDDFDSYKGYLMMFICNHCPYVKHVEEELVNLGTYCKEIGVQVFAISSNDVEQYPEDGPDKMKELSQEKSFPFPYLYDETQDVAKAYQAACTPDFYLFNSKKELVYRGQLDESRPGNNIPVSGHDLRSAINNLINNSPIDEKQYPSLGCNIKWKN